MNSKYMIIDTENVGPTPQLRWWATNKEIYFYPKIWDSLNEIDINFYNLNTDNIIEPNNLKKKLTELATSEDGVLLITGDNSPRREMFKNMSIEIESENPLTDNRITRGDNILYDTPITSVDDLSTVWYCKKGEDVDEVYENFVKKYVNSYN